MSEKKQSFTENLSVEPKDRPAASFFKLLGCWVYDFMLLSAVWLLAVIIYIIPAQMLIGVDATNKNNLSTTEFSGPIFYSYLFFITWFFFAWFWTHGGQTLGLRSWSLRLETEDGNTLNWVQTLLRLLIAGTPWLLALFVYQQLTIHKILPTPYQYGAFIIGFIGLFWILIDKKNRSIQDILTQTRIVSVPKKAKRNKLY